MSRTIRIATRSSPMALHQAEQVAAALEALDLAIGTELVKVTTAGDRWMGDLAKLAARARSSRKSTAPCSTTRPR